MPAGTPHPEIRRKKCHVTAVFRRKKCFEATNFRCKKCRLPATLLNQMKMDDFSDECRWKPGAPPTLHQQMKRGYQNRWKKVSYN